MSIFPINNEAISTLQLYQEELFELNDNKDKIDARIKELNGRVDSILLTHFYQFYRNNLNDRKFLLPFLENNNVFLHHPCYHTPSCSISYRFNFMRKHKIRRKN